MSECPDARQIQVEAYAYTHALSRSRWAWEFLRRNPDFLKDVAREPPGTVSVRPACPNTILIKPRTDQTAADRWGLAFFPNPNANGLDANAFWSGTRFPRQIQLHVSPAMPGETCEIRECARERCRIVHLVDAAGREHLLVRGGAHIVQVRCTGCTLLTRDPVRLGFMIRGADSLVPRLRLLEDALRVFAPVPAPTPPLWTRTQRALRNALIAWDCQQEGLSLRQTAQIIYGKARANEAWAGPDRAMKDEIRRARKRARTLIDGRYRDLLAPSASGRRRL